jgi:4-amino-4-deoxy-L-arabinose transferase-like glycosyltransferase
MRRQIRDADAQTPRGRPEDASPRPEDGPVLPVETRSKALARTTALAAVGLALASYVAGLGSTYVPSIGDEPYYLQIARRTAESGALLPLRSEAGITDTKPPLLFWQGIAATRWGQDWDLLRLRLPVVLLTFATAGVVAWVARRATASSAAAVVAGLVFLGFRSTIQYGRPFLTNAGETLFLFLPLALVVVRRRTGAWMAVACGLSLGAAALFKSFFLVLPATLGLGLVLLRRERWQVRALMARHGAFLAAAPAVGLAIFALWPLLDPRPDLVLSQFVLGENAAKLKAAGYLAGLVSGPWPIWRIWLGDLANAGLYAPLLVALLLDLWRRRRAVPELEQDLWLWILAFLAVYSVPSQRQENYLLPTCAALAVLLAIRWQALPDLAFRIPLAALALVAALVPVLEVRLDAVLGPGLFGILAWIAPIAVAVLAAAGVVRIQLGRAALPYLGVAILLVVAGFLAPFAPPFPAAALAEVRGRPVLFPDRFLQSQEIYRFLAPGADIRRYPCPHGPERCPHPAPGLEHAALLLDVGEPVPAGWEAIAEIPQLKQRHSPEQIRQLAGGRIDLLAERLVLARPARWAQAGADADALAANRP